MEVIGALNSLLLRAGLPQSPTEQNLMARVVELEGQNRRLNADILTERVSLTDARDALTAANNKHQCQICVSDEVSHAMVPCGHVICATCASSLRGNKCPFCRRNIEQKVRVLIG